VSWEPDELNLKVPCSYFLLEGQGRRRGKCEGRKKEGKEGGGRDWAGYNLPRPLLSLDLILDLWNFKQ